MSLVKAALVLSATVAGVTAYITPGLTTGYAPWMVNQKHFDEERNIFTCINTHDKISLSSVNDGYCDCQDGSDELGTGACDFLPPIQQVNPLRITTAKQTISDPTVAVASFHCQNKGFRTHPIPLSHINDGICDCCDGSDEWTYPSLCTNTCRQQRQEEEKKIQDLIEQNELGLKDQHEKLETNNVIVMREREMTSLMATIEEIEQLQVELGLLSPDHVRTPMQIRGDVAYELNMEIQRVQQAKNKKNEEKEEKEKNQELESGEMLFPYPKEYQFDAQKDNNVVNNSGKKVDEEESLLTSSRIIAVSRRGAGRPTDNKTFAQVHMLRNKLQVLLRKEAFGKTNLVRLSSLSEVGKLVAAFRGDCAVAELEKYAYKFCIDGVAVQQEDRREAILGYFQHVESEKEGKSQNTALEFGKKDDDADLVVDDDGMEDNSVVLVYAHGDKCWNGPERSVRVTVKCSGSWVIEQVSEPSTCVYEMKARGPIACEEGLKERLEAMYAGAYNDDDLPYTESKVQIKDEL